VTIVTDSTRNLPGLSIRLCYQVGCATTHDYPSEKTVTSAQADQARRLTELTADIERAYRFFTQGDHPCRSRLSWLSPDGEGRSEPFYWQDAEIRLFLRPDAPEILHTKLIYDLAVSLAFEPDLRTRAPFALPRREAGLTDFVASYYWLPSMVGLACREPAEFRRLSELPTDRASHQGDMRFRLKVLQRVLDRAPYGDAILADLALLDPRESLRYAILLSSDLQAPELADLVARSKVVGFEDYFEPLLAR
jgi:hypothetical protein